MSSLDGLALVKLVVSPLRLERLGSIMNHDPCHAIHLRGRAAFWSLRGAQISSRSPQHRHVLRTR